MPADEARGWLAQYRTLLYSLQHRRVGRRALSTYVGLHTDAKSILTMALDDLTDSQRRHQLARHHADKIVLDDLSTLALPVAQQPAQPAPRRGFPPLAAATPPAAPPPQDPLAPPPASRPKHR